MQIAALKGVDQLAAWLRDQNSLDGFVEFATYEQDEIDSLS